MRKMLPRLLENSAIPTGKRFACGTGCIWSICATGMLRHRYARVPKFSQGEEVAVRYYFENGRIFPRNVRARDSLAGRFSGQGATNWCLKGEKCFVQAGISHYCKSFFSKGTGKLSCLNARERIPYLVVWAIK